VAESASAVPISRWFPGDQAAILGDTVAATRKESVMKTILLFLLTACLATSPALAVQSPQSRAAVAPRADLSAEDVERRVAILRRTSAELRSVARQALPRNLTQEESAQAKDYNAWLLATSRRLDALASEGDSVAKAGAPQERTMSFNLQYLQLQTQMQDENRRYTAISNIMKTRHDTAKNSISNVR